MIAVGQQWQTSEMIAQRATRNLLIYCKAPTLQLNLNIEVAV